MTRLLKIYFKPPLAIARVGGSSTPVEAFIWDTQRTIHGAHQTVVRPAVTLSVRADGSVQPYLPYAIRFRDGEQLRPVAPFFELWAGVQDADGSETCRPLTLGLLTELDASMDGIGYTITVANRKAQRRTGSATCAFVARASVIASDHSRKPLLASSPHDPGEVPLVAPDRPITLGYFQVIRPVQAQAMDIDLSHLRVQFTPAGGEVYGPPTAVWGPASPLPPGGALDPSSGRLHEIVPARNRILNPDTFWSSYVMDTATQEDPQPSDSYDGANVGERRSWGVVDDTCDGVIEAQVVVDGVRYSATARVISTCPDFAPDRRLFYSLADDLADRDLEIAAVASDIGETEAEIADLFQRVFETVSLVNLDSTRHHGIRENAADPMPDNPEGLPCIDFRSMTRDDQPYADLAATQLETDKPAADSDGVPHDRLPYTELARMAHARLADVETLIDVLQSRRERVELLIRPPFGRFRDLEAVPGPRPNPYMRDPRVARDALQDMRMPPYMRDSDETPLSITRRQYKMLMDFLYWLADAPKHASGGAGANRPNSPVARHARRLAERLGSIPPQP